MTETITMIKLPAEIEGRKIVMSKHVEGGWNVIVEWSTEAERKRIFSNALLRESIKGSEYAVGFVSNDEAWREQTAVDYARMTNVAYTHSEYGPDEAMFDLLID